MSEAYKHKYEVLKILRDNILKGLEAFGLPVSTTQEDGGWRCFEAEQPSFRNLDKVVAVYMENSERVGWQGAHTEFNEDTQKYETTEHFIDQQTWKISVIYKRTTAEVTEESMPYTTTDIAGMLIAWFNRQGCAEFRKNGCANLLIKAKDLQTYKSTSDVSQWISEFPLKLQVFKVFTYDLDSAVPVLEGVKGV